MDKKDTSKLLLTIIMGVVLVLFFNINFTGLLFHKFIALLLIGMFTYHIILNKDWIKAVSKNLKNKDFKSRYKVIYILNIILGVSFIILLLSEAFIYKNGILGIIKRESGFWFTTYNITSKLTLILISVHIGIHLDYLIENIKKFIKGLNSLEERKVIVKFLMGISLAILLYVPIEYYFQNNTQNVVNIKEPNQQETDNRDFKKMIEDENNNNNNNNNNNGNLEDFFGNEDLEDFFEQFRDSMDEGSNGNGMKQPPNGSRNPQDGASEGNSRF